MVCYPWPHHNKYRIYSKIVPDYNPDRNHTNIDSLDLGLRMSSLHIRIQYYRRNLRVHSICWTKVKPRGKE